MKKELRSKKLVSVGSHLEMTMDVRINCERPSAKVATKSHAQALRTYLQSQPGIQDKVVGWGASQSASR